MLCLMLLLLPAAGWAQGAPDGVEPITSLQELRRLSPEEAAQGLPVDITGVLTYVEIPRDLCIIQNEDGAAYVHFRTENGGIAGRSNLKLEPGDRVRLRGVTNPGGFAPSIWYPENGNIRVNVLGKAPLPEAMRLFPAVVIDPPLDSYRVAVPGVATDIRTASGRTVVTFNDAYDEFDLLIAGRANPEALPEGLINSRISATGVFGSITDENRRLVHARFLLPSADAIEIIEKGAEAVFAKKPVTYEELSGYQAVTGERVHVRGMVTAAFPPRRLFIRMGGEPLEIHTNLEALPSVGTEVRVAGYRGIEGERPFLHTVAIREGAYGANPDPQPISLSAPLEAMRHGELVSIEARLADTLQATDHSLLLLDDGPSTLTAHLPQQLAKKQAPPVGAWVQITGILMREPTSQAGETSGLRLHLRGLDDIVILSRPAFWTAPRIAAVLGVLLLASAALAGWSFWLRHLVHEQAQVLSAKKEAEQVQSERNRIARDLHDTLEQDLVALSMQLNLARDSLSKNGQHARNSLESARRILQRTRMESRHSIRELREADFAKDHLGSALARLVEQFEMDSGAVIELQAPPDCRLCANTQRHALLVLREAIHNAIHHAEADTIVLRGQRKGDDCLLEVCDDGHGFDPSELPKGHFGIKGMRERAHLLHADFDVQSSPEGTKVRLCLPGVYASSTSEKAGAIS